VDPPSPRGAPLSADGLVQWLRQGLRVADDPRQQARVPLEPRNLLYAALPEFLPECGYQAVYKRAEGLRRSLERANLPPEKLEELLKRLHLQDKE
jgi:hypothetical protein